MNFNAQILALSASSVLGKRQVENISATTIPLTDKTLKVSKFAKLTASNVPSESSVQGLGYGCAGCSLCAIYKNWGENFWEKKEHQLTKGLRVQDHHIATFLKRPLEEMKKLHNFLQSRESYESRLAQELFLSQAFASCVVSDVYCGTKAETSEKIKWMLSIGVSTNQLGKTEVVDVSGRIVITTRHFLLFEAIRLEKIDLVRQLIFRKSVSAGAVETDNDYIRTCSWPLMVAAYTYNVQLVRLLLSAGAIGVSQAMVNVIDRATSARSRRYNWNLFKLLLYYGADHSFVKEKKDEIRWNIDDKQHKLQLKIWGKCSTISGFPITDPLFAQLFPADELEPNHDNLDKFDQLLRRPAVQKYLDKLISNQLLLLLAPKLHFDFRAVPIEAACAALGEIGGTINYHNPNEVIAVNNTTIAAYESAERYCVGIRWQLSICSSPKLLPPLIDLVCSFFVDIGTATAEVEVKVPAQTLTN